MWKWTLALLIIPNNESRYIVVDHLFSSLGLDKAEWLEDIQKGHLRASWV